MRIYLILILVSSIFLSALPTEAKEDLGNLITTEFLEKLPEACEKSAEIIDGFQMGSLKGENGFFILKFEKNKGFILTTSVTIGLNNKFTATTRKTSMKNIIEFEQIYKNERKLETQKNISMKELNNVIDRLYFSDTDGKKNKKAIIANVLSCK